MQSDTILTRAFILAWFASLFDGLGWLLYLHFSGFLQDLGADEIQIGLIIGVASISSLLVRPWVGNSLDRRGRRPVILVGNVVNVTALALYLTVSTIGPWVYVVRIVHGVGLGLLFTLSSPTRQTSFPKAAAPRGWPSSECRDCCRWRWAD